MANIKKKSHKIKIKQIWEITSFTTDFLGSAT